MRRCSSPSAGPRTLASSCAETLGPVLWVLCSRSASPEPPGPCHDACKFLGCSLILWPVDFQSSSICQTDYFELPFGLCLMCSQCSSAWLEPGGFMPGDSHRTVGKLLALSFWEDSAVLEQMAAWIPTVSACVLPRPFPHSCVPAIATGQFSCRVSAPFLSVDPGLLARGASICQRT